MSKERYPESHLHLESDGHVRVREANIRYTLAEARRIIAEESKVFVNRAAARPLGSRRVVSTGHIRSSPIMCYSGLMWRSWI